MTLHLPDFRHDYLWGLSYCSIVHADDGMGDLGLPFRAFAEYEVQGGKALLVAQIEHSDEDKRDNIHFHYHVDIDRIERARLTTGFEKKSVDELKLIMERLAGLSSSAYVDGKYSVPRHMLPAGGIVNTLLNVSTAVGQLRLEQRGGQFDIDDEDEYFFELTWRLDPGDKAESIPECIKGVLTGCESSRLGDTYLTRAAEMLEKGIRLLILEIGDEGIDDSDSTRVSDAKKKAAGE